MKSLLENEARLFWQMAPVLLHSADREARTEARDELQAIARFSDNEALRNRCLRLLADNRVRDRRRAR